MTNKFSLYEEFPEAGEGVEKSSSLSRRPGSAVSGKKNSGSRRPKSAGGKESKGQSVGLQIAKSNTKNAGRAAALRAFFGDEQPLTRGTIQDMSREELIVEVKDLKQRNSLLEQQAGSLRVENKRLDTEGTKMQQKIERLISNKMSSTNDDNDYGDKGNASPSPGGGAASTTTGGGVMTDVAAGTKRELEKSLLVRHLKQQITSLRTQVSDKVNELEAYKRTTKSSNITELLTEREEYFFEAKRLRRLVKDLQDASAAGSTAGHGKENSKENKQSQHHHATDAYLNAHAVNRALKVEVSKLAAGFEDVFQHIRHEHALALAKPAASSPKLPPNPFPVAPVAESEVVVDTAVAVTAPPQGAHQAPFPRPVPTSTAAPVPVSAKVKIGIKPNQIAEIPSFRGSRPDSANASASDLSITEAANQNNSSNRSNGMGMRPRPQLEVNTPANYTPPKREVVATVPAPVHVPSNLTAQQIKEQKEQAEEDQRVGWALGIAITDAELVHLQSEVTKETAGFQLRLSSDWSHATEMIKKRGLVDQVVAIKGEKGEIIVKRIEKEEEEKVVEQEEKEDGVVVPVSVPVPVAEIQPLRVEKVIKSQQQLSVEPVTIRPTPVLTPAPTPTPAPVVIVSTAEKSFNELLLEHAGCTQATPIADAEKKVQVKERQDARIAAEAAAASAKLLSSQRVSPNTNKSFNELLQERTQGGQQPPPVHTLASTPPVAAVAVNKEENTTPPLSPRSRERTRGSISNGTADVSLISTVALKKDDHVEARYGNGESWYPGIVMKLTGGGTTVHIRYDDGDEERNVPLNRCRLIKVASPRVAALLSRGLTSPAPPDSPKTNNSPRNHVNKSGHVSPAGGSSTANLGIAPRICGPGDSKFIKNEHVEARYFNGSTWYGAVIDRAYRTQNGQWLYDLHYDDGDREIKVAENKVRYENDTGVVTAGTTTPVNEPVTPMVDSASIPVSAAVVSSSASVSVVTEANKKSWGAGNDKTFNQILEEHAAAEYLASSSKKETFTEAAPVTPIAPQHVGGKWASTDEFENTAGINTRGNGNKKRGSFANGGQYSAAPNGSPMSPRSVANRASLARQLRSATRSILHNSEEYSRAFASMAGIEFQLCRDDTVAPLEAFVAFAEDVLERELMPKVALAIYNDIAMLDETEDCLFTMKSFISFLDNVSECPFSPMINPTHGKHKQTGLFDEPAGAAPVPVPAKSSLMQSPVHVHVPVKAQPNTTGAHLPLRSTSDPRPQAQVTKSVEDADNDSDGSIAMGIDENVADIGGDLDAGGMVMMGNMPVDDVPEVDFDAIIDEEEEVEQDHGDDEIEENEVYSAPPTARSQTGTVISDMYGDDFDDN